MRYANMTLRLRTGEKVRQVNKAQARRAYEEGRTVWLNSCNMKPDNMWQYPCPIAKGEWDGATFDNTVRDYICYNCDSERGYYPNYFIEVEK